MRTIRPIAISDISETFRVRTATDENRLTSAQLTALGITESSVSEKLLGSYKGWLCEEQGSVVGFAMGGSIIGGDVGHRCASYSYSPRDRGRLAGAG